MKLSTVGLLLCAFTVPAVWAQYTTGRLEGTIADTAGGSVAGAAVSVTSQETNQRREVVSSGTGQFFVGALPPGRYQVRVFKPGFREVLADVEVVTSETLTHNFTLGVQGQVETVNVEAEPDSHWNTSEPVRSVTRGQLELQTLPNASRTIANIVALSPGVTPTFSPRGGNLTTLSIAQAGQINANGGRSKATAHQLDFTDANDWEFGGLALSTQPSPDMMQEFKILTNNWAAEYGVKSNAQILMVTRAGGNQLHGSAYDYLQNAALNSRDYFDRTGDATPLRQNMFGIVAGAPVVKDKIFFFGGYEGRRTRGSSPVTIANVPTQAARDKVTDANVKQLLPMLPLPTAPTSNPNIGTVAVSAPTPSDADMYLLRGDAALTEGHTLTLRYFESKANSYNRTSGSLPGYDATFAPVGRNAMIAETWVINPTTTNEVRLSYGRASALFTPETTPATPRFSVTGLVGFGTVQSWPQGRIFNVYQVNDSLSHVQGKHILKGGFDLRYIQDNSINDSNRRGIYSFASIDTFLAGQPASFTQLFGNTYRGFRTTYHGFYAQDDWRVRRDLTVSLGLRWELQGGLSEVNRLQSVLDPTLTGSVGSAGTGALGAFRNEKPSVLANDVLPAPRIGIAWNPNQGRYVVRAGYGIYFDSFIFNGLQAGRYTPPTNYTGTLSGSAISGANSFANLLVGTALVQQQYGNQVGNFGALTNLGSITSSLPDLRNPYAQHFSFGLQSRLSASTVLDASYVGTRGVALTTMGPGNSVLAGNRPAPASSLDDERARLARFQTAAAKVNGAGNPRLDPRFNDVSLLRDNGASTYHSLQLSLRQAAWHGLQLQMSYTWSKSIDNASDYSPGQTTNDRSYAQDQFNQAAERAVSAFDIPHRFTLTHVWQLPWWKEQRGLAGRALGGWTFASINQWQTGVPYTVMSGARLGIADVNMDGAGSGSLDNVRASCVAGGAGFTFNDPSTLPLPALRGVNGAANSAGFKYVQPLLGNNGTCGRNTERISNLLNFDWTFSKAIRMAERGPLGSGPWNAEFRADLLNVFNTPYLFPSGDDYRNLASSSFGLANSAGASRRVQLSLRVNW